MSASNLTSAGQFAALALIGSSAPYLEMAVTQLVINLRYCLMACSLSQKLGLQTGLAHRFFAAFGVTDEILGVSVCKEGILSPFYSYGLMSMGIPGWSIGMLCGVISGGLLLNQISSGFKIIILTLLIAGAAAFPVAVILAYREGSLFNVAFLACFSVFLVELCFTI